MGLVWMERRRSHLASWISWISWTSEGEVIVCATTRDGNLKWRSLQGEYLDGRALAYYS